MMPEKIQVPADFEEICDAFEDSSIDHRNYFDLETGEILFISEERASSKVTDRRSSSYMLLNWKYCVYERVMPNAPYVLIMEKDYVS